MSGPVQLLDECGRRDARLLPDGGGGLVLDAPRDALTPELLARLRARKAELLALLTTPAAPCPKCRCALFLLRGAAVVCAHCAGPAARRGGGAVRLLVLDAPAGRRWGDYDEELRSREPPADLPIEWDAAVEPAGRSVAEEGLEPPTRGL